MERFVARLLGFFQKFTPKSWQLSGTIALEHFTAILGDRSNMPRSVRKRTTWRFI